MPSCGNAEWLFAPRTGRAVQLIDTALSQVQIHYLIDNIEHEISSEKPKLSISPF
jgi:hypothetical protein